MKPTLSYIIWFSQRAGSSVLCRALEDLGIAGRPNEWLHDYGTFDLMRLFGVNDSAALQHTIWQSGLTSNGVFGMKVSFHEPHNTKMTEQFRQFPGCPQGNVPRAAVWEHAFPNCRHIFMTRRNKVRLAVSWWKAIRSGEWHRTAGGQQAQRPNADDYRFDAIRHLLLEANMREAGVQEFLAATRIVPHTVVYEDFMVDYAATIRSILDYLEIPGRESVVVPLLHYERLADDLSEQWVQRFRRELQSKWSNKGWGWEE